METDLALRNEHGNRSSDAKQTDSEATRQKHHQITHCKTDTVSGSEPETKPGVPIRCSATEMNLGLLSSARNKLGLWSSGPKLTWTQI